MHAGILKKKVAGVSAKLIFVKIFWNHDFWISWEGPHPIVTPGNQLRGLVADPAKKQP